jgi:hypothetical protein
MPDARFAASALHRNVEAFMSVWLIPVECDSRFFLIVYPQKAQRVHGLGQVEPAREMFLPDAHGRFRLTTRI